jgi:hypothetical protein
VETVRESSEDETRATLRGIQEIKDVTRLDVARGGVVGRGVRDSREVIVGKGTLRFGIWAKDSPTWSWFVGGSGKVMCTVGRKDFPLRHQRDVIHHKEKTVQWSKFMATVDVVLFQGWRPTFSHEAWCQPGVKTIVGFNQGLRSKEWLLLGWKLTKKTLCHARAGGITNTKSVVFVTMWRAENNMRWKQRADGFQTP